MHLVIISVTTYQGILLRTLLVNSTLLKDNIGQRVEEYPCTASGSSTDVNVLVAAARPVTVTVAVTVSPMALESMVVP